MRKFILLLGVLNCTIILSCTSDTSDPNFVVAKVNGEKITLSQIDELKGLNIYYIRKEIYNNRQRALDELISEKLLFEEANRRGLTPEALKTEITSNSPKIDEEEANRFWEIAKKSRPDVTKEMIVSYLKDRSKVLEQRKFIESLKAKTKIEKYISKLEPVMPKLKINIDNEPFIGEQNAKILIIEFTDFECPVCAKTHQVLNKIIEEYKGRIKFVRKDYPLPIHVHPNAMNTHLAANCSMDQNKYWEYTEKIWQHRTELALENLKKYAKELDMDMKKFNECLTSKKYNTEIEKDVMEANQYGIRGVPAVFINGNLLSGYNPFEAYKEVIDKEL